MQYNQPQAKAGMSFTRPAAVAFVNIEVPVGTNGELRKMAKGAPIQADTNNPVDRSLLNAAYAANAANGEPVSIWAKLTVQLVPSIDPNAPDLDLPFISGDPVLANSAVNPQTGEVTFNQPNDAPPVNNQLSDAPSAPAVIESENPAFNQPAQ